MSWIKALHGGQYTKEHGTQGANILNGNKQNKHSDASYWRSVQNEQKVHTKHTAQHVMAWFCNNVAQNEIIFKNYATDKQTSWLATKLS